MLLCGHPAASGVGLGACSGDDKPPTPTAAAAVQKKHITCQSPSRVHESHHHSKLHYDERVCACAYIYGVESKGLVEACNLHLSFLELVRLLRVSHSAVEKSVLLHGAAEMVLACECRVVSELLEGLWERARPLYNPGVAVECDMRQRRVIYG